MKHVIKMQGEYVIDYSLLRNDINRDNGSVRGSVPIKCYITVSSTQGKDYLRPNATCYIRAIQITDIACTCL